MKTENKISAVTLAFGAALNLSQLNFAVSIAFETLPLIAANPKFKMAAFARDMEEASGYTLCEKTIRNTASLSNKLQAKFGAKIGEYEGGLSNENVLHFADFFRSQLVGTDYTLTLADMSAFCESTISSAGKRAKAAEAHAAAAAALEAAATLKQEKELSEKVDAALSDAEKAKKDAEAAQKKAENAEAEAKAKAEKDAIAKKEAEQRAEALQKANRVKEEELQAANMLAEAAKAEAEAARKEADSVCIKVRVNHNGDPVIEFADNMNPAFLEAVAKAIKLQAGAARRNMKIAA